MAKATIGSAKRRVRLLSFRYQAMTEQGKEVKGTIKAINEVAAERLLIEAGYNPISVEVAPSMFSLEEALPSLFQVKPREVIVFSRQLATLLKSGISLLNALDILQGQASNSRAFRRVLQDIVDDIRAGGSFPQAITKHPRVFNEVYCRTISVGEQSGNIEVVLNQMADYLEKQTMVAKKIGRALTYPIMVLVAGIVVVIVLITTVMPSLLDMFSSVGAELPATTRMLMKATELANVYKLQLLVALACFGALILWMVKQPTGRRILDRIKLTAPVIGAPTLMSELARFSRTMSVLVKAGVRLQEIMEMVPQSTNNIIMREALNRVREGLLLGEGLSDPMQRTGVFPPLLVQMVSVGEESNTLDYTMSVVADFYETTAEEKTSAMVGMIGPISTVFMALVVGFIALSVIMPMYTITGSFA